MEGVSDGGARTPLSSPTADGVAASMDLTVAIAVSLSLELADFTGIGSDGAVLGGSPGEIWEGEASLSNSLTGSALISLSPSLVSSSLLLVDSSLVEESSDEEESEAEPSGKSEVSVEAVSSEVNCSDEEISEVRGEDMWSWGCCIVAIAMEGS